jgi:hypothetical protein
MMTHHYEPIGKDRWAIRVGVLGGDRGVKVGEIRRKRGRRVSYVAWGEVLPQVFIAVMRRGVRPNTLTGVCWFVQTLNRRASV